MANVEIHFTSEQFMTKKKIKKDKRPTFEGLNEKWPGVYQKEYSSAGKPKELGSINLKHLLTDVFGSLG